MPHYENNGGFTDLELLIKEVLKAHAGKAEAIPRVQLVKLIPSVGERKIRKTIEHLRVRHGLPIGSCPHGYFWAPTPEEIEEVVAYFRSYGLSCLQVASRLQKVPFSMLMAQLTFDAMRHEEKEE